MNAVDTKRMRANQLYHAMVNAILDHGSPKRIRRLAQLHRLAVKRCQH